MEAEGLVPDLGKKGKENGGPMGKNMAPMGLLFLASFVLLSADIKEARVLGFVLFPIAVFWPFIERIWVGGRPNGASSPGNPNSRK